MNAHGIGVALFLAVLFGGCAASHDTSCDYACSTELRCDGDSVVLRSCDIAERGFRHTFCDSRGAVESLASACERACVSRGACDVDDLGRVDVRVCDCMEGE